jgi:hypothetical protein
MRIKMVFLYRSRSCLSLHSRKQMIQSTLLSVPDYGHIVYMNAAATSLYLLDVVYHRALHFITGDNVSGHHCSLYQKVGWPSLMSRRLRHTIHCYVFIYKALLHKVPLYLAALLHFRHNVTTPHLRDGYLLTFLWSLLS